MDKLIIKKRIFSIILVFFYFFIFTLLLNKSFGYLDPDLGWHLKVGEEIARTGLVPEVNHYNYTFTGNWVDHEWLSNFIVYELYSHWGYIALSVLFSLLIVGILIILYFWVRRVYPKASPFLIIILQLFGVVASSPHFGVRVQETGLLFLVLILLILHAYDKRRNWKTLIWLMPLMYLWACLHGSFLIGYVMMLLWIGIRILEKMCYKFFKKDWIDFSGILKWREIAIFAGAALTSIIVTFFTPYGMRLYSFMSGYKDSFYQTHILEWLPQFFYPFQYKQLFYLALVSTVVCLYIYYSRGKKRRWQLSLWDLGLIGLFVILSFKSHRHFPLMFAATFVFSVGILSELLHENRGKKDDDKAWLKNNWLAVYIIFCLFLATVLQVVTTNFTSNPFLSYRGSYPIGATEFLQERPQYNSKRLFNEYSWGGYMIWKSPERRLFIDGRLPQVRYQGQTFLEEYFDFFNKPSEIAQKLTDYKIDLVLISVRDQVMKAKRWEQIFFGLSDKNMIAHNYLRDYLFGSTDWRVLYYDKTAVIYERIK